MNFERVYLNALREKKDHLIKKMVNLSDEERATLVSFFKTHENLEGKVDQRVWSKPEGATFADFEPLLAATSKSRSNARKETKRDMAKAFDGHEVKVWYRDDRFVFASPLDHDACVFMNSFDCFGTGARWCVGDSNVEYYYEYLDVEGGYGTVSAFVFVYDAAARRKFMVQVNDDSWTVWNAEDRSVGTGDAGPGMWRDVLEEVQVEDVDSFLEKPGIVDMTRCVLGLFKTEVRDRAVEDLVVTKKLKRKALGVCTAAKRTGFASSLKKMRDGFLGSVAADVGLAKAKGPEVLRSWATHALPFLEWELRVSKFRELEDWEDHVPLIRDVQACIEDEDASSYADASSEARKRVDAFLDRTRRFVYSR